MSVNSAAAPGRPSGWLITLAELKIGLRTQAFRAVALVCFALGIVVGGAPGRGVAFSAYAAADTAWQGLGLLATAWMSLAAVRETSLRTASLVYSKPQPTERLVLARFVGGIAPVFGFLAALFAGAVVARLFTGQGLIGFPVYFVQMLRAAAPILFAAGLAFCLALLFDSALAGSLAGLAWMVLIAGRAYLPKALFPAYSQNSLYFGLFGVGLVLLASAFHRKGRRGSAARPVWLTAASASLLLLPAWGLYRVAIHSHDPQIRMNPLVLRMAAQHAEIGKRAPGFSFPDQNGRSTSLSDFPGKIMVLAIVTPEGAESASSLAQLESIQRKYGGQGVQCAAVCTSQDEGAAATLARGMGLSYPVVQDIGTYNGPAGMEHSPIAEAYEALNPPKVIVTDRRRRVRKMLIEQQSYEGSEIEQAVMERLESEPRI